MKRLLRDIKFYKGWFVAFIVLVALACGIYVGFRSCYDSAYASFNRAYKELNTPDVIVTTRPIEDLSGEIKKLPGVSAVSLAFLVDCYTLIDDKRVREELNGVEIGERVNDYQILDGRDLKGGDDVVVELHYAFQHDVKPGREVTLHVQGKVEKLRVCGICFSLKHIYMFSEEGVFEEDYGVFFVPRETIGKHVNTFYIKMSEDANIEDVVSSVESFFSDRGIGAVVQRRDKLIAYTAAMEDVKSLNLLADLFTTILLATSAVVLFVALFRLVERKEIETLRAMGFSKWNVFSYYLSFSGVALMLGVLLSIPLSLGILHFILGYYTAALRIPSRFLIYNLNFSYLAYCTVFTLVFFSLGSFLPSFQAASLAPAEAMRPYIGSQRGARIMVTASMSPMKKLIFREMFGHKIRSVGTVLVIALVLSFGLSFALSMGSFNEAIKQRFDKNELWDVRVSFTTQQTSSILNELSRIPGVESVEPCLSSAAEISFKNKSAFIQLRVLKENTKMHVFSFTEGGLSPNGIVVSGDVAHKLGVSVGEEVELSTPFGTTKAEISGVIQELGSSEGYAFRDLTIFSEALLKARSGEEKQVEKSIRDLPFVESWVTREELRHSWFHFLDLFLSFVYAMDLVTLTLVLTTVGVFAFLSTKERVGVHHTQGVGLFQP